MVSTGLENELINAEERLKVKEEHKRKLEAMVKRGAEGMDLRETKTALDNVRVEPSSNPNPNPDPNHYPNPNPSPQQYILIAQTNLNALTLTPTT